MRKHPWIVGAAVAATVLLVVVLGASVGGEWRAAIQAREAEEATRLLAEEMDRQDLARRAAVTRERERAEAERNRAFNEALEAILFALLAHATARGQPANAPRTTGATHPVILGKIIPGHPF